MKRMDVVDGALAPSLTRWDLKVLAALPPRPSFEDFCNRTARSKMASAWQIAEAVNEDDVAYVRSTLKGLADRRLAWSTIGFPDSKRKWTREEAGDDYLAEVA